VKRGLRKAVVIYDTKFGNTEKIARALSEGMKNEGLLVD
jgi:flavorubredoxin